MNGPVGAHRKRGSQLFRRLRFTDRDGDHFARTCRVLHPQRGFEGVLVVWADDKLIPEDSIDCPSAAMRMRDSVSGTRLMQTKIFTTRSP
jgi:hypothetical protein